MFLKSDWKDVIKRAWSIRLIILAGLFSGFEIIMPFLPELVPIQRGVFAALSFVATAGAFVTRLLAQKNLSPETSND